MNPPDSTQPSSNPASDEAGLGFRGQRRRAAIAWTGGVLSVVLLAIEYRLRVLHPASVLFLFFMVLTVGPALAAGAVATWRVVTGNFRHISPWWTIAAVLPTIGWATWGAYGFRALHTREVPQNLSMRLLEMAGASVMEARAVYLMPHRIETSRLIMFYDDGIPDPQRDAAEMDQHVARMETLTGLRLRTKIFLIRAPILANRHVSFLGLAFGSSQGPAGYVDRHELAHAVIGQHGGLSADPPTLLAEGWAESQSKNSEQLAEEAVNLRGLISDSRLKWPRTSPSQKEELLRGFVDWRGIERLISMDAPNGGEPSYLRELTSGFWYHHDNGAVYSIGGALADYLIRTYGAGKFVRLYFACRPDRFEQECKRVLGIELESLEKDFWQEEERIPRRGTANDQEHHYGT